jgi:hypothetical protein
MKKLQILGTGCPKCRMLTDHTEQAAKALGLAYTLEKVTDINEIVAFGVLATPASSWTARSRWPVACRPPRRSSPCSRRRSRVPTSTGAHRRPSWAGGRRRATTRRGRHLWRIALVAALAAAVAIVLACKPGRDVTAEPTAHVAPAASHASCRPDPACRAWWTSARTAASRARPWRRSSPSSAWSMRAAWRSTSSTSGRTRQRVIRTTIYMIPTQIFFDGDGRELARHQGFLSKADILATWKRLGFDFSVPAPHHAES